MGRTDHGPVGQDVQRDDCYLWEDIEISSIEEGHALNSWLIGL